MKNNYIYKYYLLINGDSPVTVSYETLTKAKIAMAVYQRNGKTVSLFTKKEHKPVKKEPDRYELVITYPWDRIIPCESKTKAREMYLEYTNKGAKGYVNRNGRKYFIA